MDSRKKYIKSSMLMSALMMGLGQVYNKYFLKGIFFFLIEIVFVANLGKTLEKLRGLITLGDTPQKMMGFKIVQGDHSIFMMVDGAIALITSLIFVGIYIFNIFDARGCVIKSKEKNLKKYLYSIYENNFIKIMLIPGALAVLFFVVLPKRISFF